LAPRSAAEIEAAAVRDPENPPLTEARTRQLRPVPRVKTLRRALALTQEEFAIRYHIPLGTLRDWEQGRSEPDQPAKAYLTVIARDPEGVERALHPVSS
jgi:putative transcriptional regulator